MAEGGREPTPPSEGREVSTGDQGWILWGAKGSVGVGQLRWDVDRMVEGGAGADTPCG